MARRKARELAFRTLFMAERSDTPVLEVWEDVLGDLRADPDSEDTDEAYGEALDESGISFARSLVRVWADRHDEVDETILGSLEGWTFNQMNQTDLNVLRLAVSELLSDNDVPPQVTIEMAVRQARKFGGEESGRFVNGVLGRIFRAGKWGAADDPA